jgi:hypothetical protein
MSDDLASSEGGNGAAVDIEFEDSSPLHAAVDEAVGVIASMPKAEEIAAHIVKLSRGGGGGGNGNGDDDDSHRRRAADDKKAKRKHSALIGVISVLFGSGGAMGVVYATSDRSKANEIKVEAAAKHIENFEPRLDKTEGDIQYIKAEIKDFGEDVDTAMVQQKVIIEGIEDLKKENVNRLQDELRDARRELRRRPRRP